MTKASRPHNDRSLVVKRRCEILGSLQSINMPKELMSELLDTFENFYCYSDIIITRVFIAEDRNTLLELTVLCDVLQTSTVAA